MTPTDHDHLDDDVLSAVLDGEAAADESLHADACERCASRIADLRDASMLVRSPVPDVDPAQREAAIAAALAAAALAAGDRRAEVVPLRRRLPAAWLATAALVAVALALVVLLPRDRDDDLASRGVTDEAAEMAADDAAGTGGETMSALAEPVDGGDLGELAGADLQAAISEAFARRATALDAPAGAESAPATTTAGAEVACVDAVRDGNPRLAELVFRATGTFEGEPVVVLAFDVVEDGEVRRWVYVVGAEACVIKNQQTFSV